MTLADFIIEAKREARYGDISKTTDQATADILRSLNKRMLRFWRLWAWDWSMVTIDQAMVAGQTDYTIIPPGGEAIGDIIILQCSDDDYMRPVTLKRYYQWLKSQTDSPNLPTKYVKLGLDALGQHEIRVWPAPLDSTHIQGFAKLRLTEYVVGDIATNTGLIYFPKETHDILLVGVDSDIQKIQGQDALSLSQDKAFEAKMRELIPEEVNQADGEITTPPPDFIIWKKRARGGTTVV